ncbi:nucleotide sugar dehydrogenase [Chloroflexota bacterium]
MMDRIRSNNVMVCVVGLGYVGLPLATVFSEKLKVIGFDIDAERVKELKQSKGNRNLFFTNSPDDIGQADFIIICVPTPATKSKEPDLSFIKAAAETVSRNMKKNSMIILESTVYPGVTEEIVKPVLESSGGKAGKDFKIAYCPERINPGDEKHTIDKVVKVVAGMDSDTTELVAELYAKITPHIFKAKNIRIAEAAKVIENIQRDLNIALMNEFAIIFEKMGLDTRDVLETAATKWNFQQYSPGLVGGHCIPVDPYYLVHKAKELGYNPQVILAGRAINDSMPGYVVEITIKALKNAGKQLKGSRVLILGLTYKEDVADIRESPVKGVIEGLQKSGIDVTGFDPLLAANDFSGEFNTKLLNSLDEVKKAKVDGIILTVAHSFFRKFGLNDLKNMQTDNPVLVDVRGIFDAAEAEKAGFYYETM